MKHGHFEFAGVPARLVLELETGPNTTTRLPLDASEFTINNGGHATLMVPIRGKLQERIYGTLDNVAFHGLDR